MTAVAVVTALGYADWRTPDDAWRVAHPRRKAWYEGLQQRTYVAETASVY